MPTTVYEVENLRPEYDSASGRLNVAGSIATDDAEIEVTACENGIELRIEERRSRGDTIASAAPFT